MKLVKTVSTAIDLTKIDEAIEEAARYYDAATLLFKPRVLQIGKTLDVVDKDTALANLRSALVKGKKVGAAEFIYQYCNLEAYMDMEREKQSWHVEAEITETVEEVPD